MDSDSITMLDRMFVSENTVVQELQSKVEEVSNIFVIERETGKILFKDYESLTDAQRILAVLLGKYIARMCELIPTAKLGPTEIGRSLGKARTSMAAPLAKLKNLGFLEIENGEYSINPHRLSKIIGFFKNKKAG